MSQTITKHIGEGFARGELYAALAYDTTDQFGGMKIKALMLNSTGRISFLDANVYIYAPATTQLTLVGATTAITATTSVTITTPTTELVGSATVPAIKLSGAGSVSAAAYAAVGAAWADAGTPAFIADQMYARVYIGATIYRLPLWADA